MSPNDIHQRLTEHCGAAVVGAKLDALQPWIEIAPDKIETVCRYLCSETDLAFDYLMCLSGVDYNNGTLGVVYHLSSIKHHHKLVLKTVCPKDNPHVSTVSMIWGTANWHEREAFDLLGIIFDGHPDLRRILLPYDWEGYPLRKDYKVQEFYNGIRVPY
jgi:NADH-quinone oxidoreductase subunit C